MSDARRSSPPNQRQEPPMTGIDDLRIKAEAFRRQHVAGDIVVLPNAWDRGSAALMVQAGFRVIPRAGAGIAFAHGKPDGERLGRDGMRGAAAEIAAACRVRVTADLEAGYGAGPEDVAATVTRAIEIGLVGCNIEDTD